MKKFYKKLLILSLLLMPTMVFASSGENDFPIVMAIAMELFISIHMSIFCLKPLADLISKEDSKKTFWRLFAIRAGILLFFDFFVTTFIAIIDFFAVFVGAFVIIPIVAAKNKYRITPKTNQVIKDKNATSAIPNQEQVNGIELKCSKCNGVLQITDKICPGCGQPFDGNNVIVSENPTAGVKIPNKISVLPSSFDQMYRLPEDKMLEEFINKELTKLGIDKSTKLIPSDALKRKKILNFIFSFLVFVFITLIFFHFPISTYIVGIVILFIFFKFTNKYDLIKYLKKEIKARPGEKISNILMNVKNTSVPDNSKKLFVFCLLIAVVLPLIIFYKPRILYEKVDNGYAVRYYLFGLTNFETATIPETYKNEKVVVLRGNTFSNMPYLKSVKLPNTITEIRGQAFKNCKRLTEVNIPENLKYLGGGAFYNAKSIKRIELPDTLTYLGGESFYGAKSLEYIKLSNNLTEIRGNSFEYCTSLKSIIIPDNVTRIGGHAFYGNYLLNEVLISKNSKLTEIGSSAFRQCSSLYNITIPERTYVNTRAFKESPTNVKRYSSSDLSTDSYKYNKYIYMYINDTKEINEYRTDSIIQDAYITLLSIDNVNGLNQFNFKYSDSNGETIITLTKSNPYKEINKNITILIKDSYVFEDYNNRVSFYAYYN